jgi:hypothetical protein
MRYAIIRADGSVSIMDTENDPRDELKRRLPRAVVEQRLSEMVWRVDAVALARERRAASLYIASDDEITISPIDSIPRDRTFRDGWVHDGKAIGFDMPKCRNIHRDNMRKARAPKLDALDVEYMRAHGDDKRRADVEARKRVLRDVTADPAIEAAKTPEELKAVWPDCLR